MKGKSHGYARDVRRWLAAAALALLSLSATAKGDAGRWTDLDWNVSGATATAQTRAGGATPTGGYATTTGKAQIGGTKALPWPGKAQAKVMANWKAMATPQAMAKAITNPAAGAITIIGGMAMKQLLDLACVRVAGGTLRPGVAWDECVMAPTVLPLYRTASSDSTLANTRDESCRLAMEKKIMRSGGTNLTYVVTGTGGETSSSYTCTVYNSGAYWTSGPINYRGTETKEEPTGDYTPIAETEANQRVEEKLQEWCTAGDPRCHGTLKELLEGGGEVETEDPEVTGPSSAEGNCTTTRTVTDQATGSYTQRTVCHDADYDYTGNTVKKTDKKTETVTQHEADGTQTGETETTTEETTDDRTTCEKTPELPQCNGDLDVPGDRVPKSEVNVAFDVENLGWGAGACPPSPSWTDKLGTHTLNLGPVCDAITNWVRPLVLAMAALMALAIAVPRSEP